MADEKYIQMEYLSLVRLSEEYQNSLTNFDCLNPDEIFPEHYSSRHRKKFRQHSLNVNLFLTTEALQEQNEGLNTTHLLFYKEILIGFISLCTDSIRLELDEREAAGVPYANIPALKIARLAIDKHYQGKGLGKFMIEFAVSKAVSIREAAGVKFITVDCYEHRLSYYEKHDFIQNKVIVSKRQSTDSPYSLRLNVDKYLEEIILD